ncbi:Alkaline phosphatase synthesis transcriptional regulatory protein PhoP [Aquimixticola soesokkakensis]|uniref:Alkaline phosphatase synthesis transcriptional regulatory protein PhoP n=1 Tax=Aquimixticola soesokkakensis TaxID=1519096 RepID=A0A1Y5TA79_9RHOB|nr:response regulator [Aquimixticola soesokkakensis]SLN57501.1 Alkaline phosphatase synthesis transcriptional regulatory protein PhoP [Aquimixticola soesokkakensis]
MRVLLIEDEPNITEALRFVLSRDGWLVDTHADGATALRAIADKAPQVIVLDVMLPNRSGFEILRDLRAQGSSVPVLMLTARGQQRDRDLAQAAGATAFMTKPFSNADIVAALRALRPSDAPRVSP